MASENKKKGNPFVIGIVMFFASIGALWKNETRFNYHLAAKKSPVVESLSEVNAGENLAFTGPMDQGLQLDGKYIETFTGYLAVYRRAQIYCWHRDEDEDGDVSWTLKWQGYLEKNSRNQGLSQKLSSGKILPTKYEVAELKIPTNGINFVDKRVEVLPGPLPKTGEAEGLTVSDNYLYLAKNNERNLGDERISYRAIPVPATATYFGKFNGSEAIADTTKKREGILNTIIGDTGILYHLVAGPREEALQTMKAHLQMVKWIVRGVGTAICVLGVMCMISSIVRFLFAIPLIGPLAERGALLISIIIGLPIAAITICLGYLAGHPLILIPLVMLVGFCVYWLMQRRKKQEALKQQLGQEYGRPLDNSEIKKLEYQEMAGMLSSEEGQVSEQGAELLDQFGDKQGWDESQRKEILDEATDSASSEFDVESQLKSLIRLAVADGKLTPDEVRTIREVATVAGYDRKQFRELMATAQKWAFETAQAQA